MVENVKVVFLNGPPRSGKDSLGDCLRDIEKFALIPKAMVDLVKMAHPLNKGIASFLGMDYFDWLKVLDESKAGKNAPHEKAFGAIPRTMMIQLSEIWAKPLMGEAVFGKLLVRRMEEFKTRFPRALSIFVVTDSGFQAEAEPVVDWAGGENCLLFHLSRTGTSFEGDSRSYIDLTSRGVQTVEFGNNDTLEEGSMRITGAVLGWVRGGG